MFIVVTHGLPYTMKEMPPDIRKVRRHEIIARTWEDEHLFDAESQYRLVPTDVPELTSFQRFLARTVYNPVVRMDARWERIGNYDSDALVAVVQKGLANDDDIIQQWFDGPDVLKLLRSATNWNEMVLAVEAIEGGHQDTPDVAAYVKRVLPNVAKNKDVTSRASRKESA